MDAMTWYRGKRLKEFIDDTHSSLRVSHLAVVMILAANEQGLTMEDIVKELILANEYQPTVSKVDKAKNLRELGY